MAVITKHLESQQSLENEDPYNATTPVAQAYNPAPTMLRQRLRNATQCNAIQC